jgi:DNA-binding transcriptional LysR family regulator
MSDVARLRYFVAVAEELHFGRAAERLFIAQPALSQQIRKLEEQLGVTLFERDRRHVGLTAAGVALLLEARAAVEQVDRALAVGRRFRSGRIGRLDIGYTPGAVGGLMGQIVRAFRDAHPDIDLELHHYSFSDVSAGLRNGEVDAGFVRLPLGVPDLRYRTLVVEPRVIALPPEHTLATRDELAIAELLDEPWIAIATNDVTWRDFWLATEHRGGRPARIGAEAATPDEAFEAVLAGRGVLLTRLTIAERFIGEGITTIPVPDAGPSHGAIAWQAATESPLLQTFIAISEEIAAGR